VVLHSVKLFMSARSLSAHRWPSSGGSGADSFDSDTDGPRAFVPQRPTTPSVPVFTIRPRTAVSNPKPKPSRGDGAYVADMERAMGLQDLITEDSLVRARWAAAI
jgi:hypothetical protein